MEIKVPFLKEEIGSGDVVKAATGAVGIKPCTPCEERRRLMNNALRFVPRQTPPPSQWTKPPEVPEGWKRIRSFNNGERGVQLFHHADKGSYIVWQIIGGEYRNSHSFCCAAMEQQAIDRWTELCQPNHSR